MCTKNYQLIQQKYSVEIYCLLFQQNNLLNVFLTGNISNVPVFQQKYFVMEIQQEIKQIYADLTGVLYIVTYKQAGNFIYFLM